MRGILIGGIIAICTWVVFAADPDVVSREAWRVQVDTNATTTVTGYTATKAGSLLSGKTGGTNAIWIATAAGTNSWLAIGMK